MKRKRLLPAVNEILEQDYEEHRWQLYCSLVANSLAETPDYEEFGKAEKVAAGSGSTTTKEQTEALVEQSQNILNNFTPPKKGGDG